ncbi:AIM24 family protein, partial [Thermodesulfobacteriota bacterium]
DKTPKAPGKVTFATLKKSVDDKKSGGDSLADTSESLLRDAFEGKKSRFFELSEDLLRINVRRGLCSKLNLLESFSGDIKFVGANKIVQKYNTDEMFGGKEGIFYDITGDGALVYALLNNKITPVNLDDEQFFVKEDYLLSFESSLQYENSARKFGEDFDLVKLTKSGTALLLSKTEIFTQKIDEKSPLNIRFDYIIGWHGNLKSKILRGQGSLFSRRSDAKWVTFTGNGYVFCAKKIGG